MAERKGLRGIVIGAGIGGLSCGIALRRAGAEVSVHEKQSALREVGSGLTLWVNAMRVLRQLEVAKAIRERGAVVDRIDNYTAAGKRLSGLEISKVADKHGAPSVSIHRAELQQGLADELPDGALRLGSECTGFEQDGKGVTVRFADGSEERADLLVGADGIHSRVRAELVGAREPRYSGYTCWRSAVKLDHPLLERRIYIQLYGSSSTFGIFPIADGWSWYGTKFTERGGGGGDGASSKREAREAFEGWYEPVRAVIEATSDEAFVRQDIYDHEPIDNWVSGRVALLGDAAHATTPTLGQGGCLAVEDAAVIGRSVAWEPDIPAALGRYQRERIERANGIVRQAWRHGKVYHGVNPLLRTFRDLFFLRAPQSIALREVDKLMGYEA